jgi:hypothetical protein
MHPEKKKMLFKIYFSNFFSFKKVKSMLEKKQKIIIINDLL